MPLREEITYIFVDVRLPRNKRYKQLSPSAKAALIALWCLCREDETDGEIDQHTWKEQPKATREQLISAGWVETKPSGDVVMHDFLDIQDSKAVLEARRKNRADAGVLGNHKRHHEAKGVRRPSCPLCYPETVA